MSSINLNTSIDIYCERVSSDLFAEPINFLSNIAFIIAFYILLRKLKDVSFSDKSHKRYSTILTYLILLIGLGSFLFHAFGNLWSAFADTLPIMIFILFYLYIAVRFYLEQTNLLSVVALIIFLSLNILLGYAGVEEISSYLTALFAMLFISAISLVKQELEISRGLFIASIIFIISLTFRQIDAFACSYIPFGTHLIWHILNAILLYSLVLLFIKRFKK
ncbi:MAG: ceramidase domain-containing protein [Rhizobiales bacterium]|nr:ceramidase domain-containing protein [Hyphomicrobiales bacterium]MBL6770846.1 ceramidase domain-containing protein [Hyphomicrobiales bacterium]